MIPIIYSLYSSIKGAVLTNRINQNLVIYVNLSLEVFLVKIKARLKSCNIKIDYAI
jgi:hypothetical protein